MRNFCCGTYCYLFLLSLFILWFTYYVSDIFRYLNDHLSGKELFIQFTEHAFRKLLSVYVFSYSPFDFEGMIWDLIVSVPDHCLSFYFSAQIVLLLEISSSCRRCTFRDCLENKTSPPPHLSCVSERSVRIKVKPLIDMRLSGWCVPNNDSKMPNISGELLLESNTRISSIFGKMCRTFKLHKCKPFDEKVKMSYSSDVSS